MKFGLMAPTIAAVGALSLLCIVTLSIVRCVAVGGQTVLIMVTLLCISPAGIIRAPSPADKGRDMGDCADLDVG